MSSHQWRMNQLLPKIIKTQLKLSKKKINKVFQGNELPVLYQHTN